MKTVISMLNSKYIHSSLAPWYLLAGVREFCDAEISAKVIESTINENCGKTADRLACENADVYAFCCYIWNIDEVLGKQPLLRRHNLLRRIKIRKSL